MINIQSIADLELLRESVDLECKLALGRDGLGALPEDFWPTYSAFANTEGGVVMLGVREKQGQFIIEGITNVAKVRKELFDSLNNRQKVSANLLTDAHAREVILEGRTLLVIEIPRATRKARPVHLTTNPFAEHTYRRLNDGDRPLPDDEVKRMLAEQVEDSRDDRILRGFEFGDLCMETFRAYRQVFANREPAHPWNALEDLDFLRQIGGWRKDRETGESGLTLAGLLMFGWMATIQEELSNYMLDYQERPEAKIEQRWADRLTLDGKWSGNLYDFYRRVYLKLTADLKVPFSLEKGERKDETPVHVALREALSNVLVHADYSDRASVLVVKRPDMFGFRNPGLMRIPPEIAIRGGEHDCRNRTLHKMFRLVGVGEQAGSGIPKIYNGWASQHWRAPALYERIEPYNQTLLELRMVDLLPKDLVAGLRKAFGARFDQLEQNQRLTLAAAASEKVVTHARVREMTGLHPFDATRLLQALVQEGFLEGHNPGRGAVYCLPGAAIPTPEEVFGASSAQSAGSSAHLPGSSAHLPAPTSGSAEQRDADGCLLSDQLDAPVIDSLDRLKPALRAELEKIAVEPRTKGKISADAMRQAILTVCKGHYVALSSLAELVNRDPDALRQQHLKPLAKEGKLRLAFPTAPTHAKQAYRAAE
jgi:predicted HTH transcriptional regulator